MNISSRLSIWALLMALVALMASNTATASTAPAKRGFFFRQKQTAAINTTDAQEEEKPKRGFTFLSVNKRQKSNETTAADKSTTIAKNNTKVDESIANKDSTTKTKGRGPFGFFKPLEKKRDKTSSDKDTPSVNSTSVDATTAAANSTASSAGNATESSSTNNTATEGGTSDSNVTIAIARPRYMIVDAPMGSAPKSRPVPARYGGGPTSPSQLLGQMDRQVLITAITASIANSVAKLWIIIWLAKRLSAEEELLAPQQHFRWECLNDRYSKDATVLKHVIAKPPQGFSFMRWGSYLKKFGPKKDANAPTGPKLPTKSVIVVDLAPNGHLEIPYISDVVNFLVASHTNTQFGPDPEIVLLMESTGGSVPCFGLAAAQIGRLKSMGLNVTVCVDTVAASGGYMMAVHSTKLIAAPFAYVGSIGVMSEALNFNKILNKYGIQPLSLKAGESKNRLSTLGPVTDADLKEEQKRMEQIHEAFIAMCVAERPSLDRAICDGTVLVASHALEYGLVDRVLTSEQYIWECIQDGAHVLKLHKSSQRPGPHYFFFRALDVLPHLRTKLQQLDTGKLLSAVIQGLTVAGMIQRTLLR